MDVKSTVNKDSGNQSEEEDEMDLRRGPWTVEEDFALINYVTVNGEGRWNSLAKFAGLKRTGKSCRLRWLNYLRPDVRRGNITLEEQLMILELHSRWGNRWSKIAQYLPGRTDNEIKNYWRTRVQKHAKQLQCDVNSKQFKDTMRYLWMPRLVERIQAATAADVASSAAGSSSSSSTAIETLVDGGQNMGFEMGSGLDFPAMLQTNNQFVDGGGQMNSSYLQEIYSTAASSSDSIGTQVSDLTDCFYNYTINQTPAAINDQDYGYFYNNNGYYYNQQADHNNGNHEIGIGVDHYCSNSEFQAMDDQSSQWMDGGGISDNLWNVEDHYWFLQQQQHNNQQQKF